LRVTVVIQYYSSGFIMRGLIGRKPLGVTMNLNKSKHIVDEYERQKSFLLMIRQDVQEAYTYLSEPAMERVGELLDTPQSHVHNAATLCSTFSLTERGRCLIRAATGPRAFARLQGPLRRDSVALNPNPIGHEAI